MVYYNTYSIPVFGLIFQTKLCVNFAEKMCWATFWAFFTKSSGHPVLDAIELIARFNFLRTSGRVFEWTQKLWIWPLRGCKHNGSHTFVLIRCSKSFSRSFHTCMNCYNLRYIILIRKYVEQKPFGVAQVRGVAKWS
jgi:hypothetical protein